MANAAERKATERVAAVLAVFLAAGEIFVMVYPSGWHLKTTHIWSFYVGLFSVEVKIDTIAGSVILKAAKALAGKQVMQKMQSVLEPGASSIQHFRDEFCNVEILSGGILNNCYVWGYLYYGGMLAAIGLGVSIVLKLTAVAMLLLPRTRCVRMAVLTTMGLASFLSFGAVIGYIALTSSFREWLVNVQLAHSGLTYGSMAIVAGVLALASPLPAVLLMACAQFTFAKDDEWEYEGEYGMQQPIYDPSMGAAPGCYDPSMGPPPPGYGPGYSVGPPQPGYYDPAMGAAPQGYGAAPPAYGGRGQPVY